MFVSAIQGMRPNLVASKWNFANFQSSADDAVQAIMMEFTTTSDYGAAPASGESEKPSSSSAAPAPARETTTVTIGSITVGGQLVAVVGSSRNGNNDRTPRGSSTRVSHLDRVLDTDTGYLAPQAIEYVWDGPSLSASGSNVKATTRVALGKPSPVSEAKGLVDKVDVLAEIPYMVRKIVNYVAGTKPYIYQTLNEATLQLEVPGQEKREVKGTVFEEHTFISSVAGEDAVKKA